MTPREIEKFIEILLTFLKRHTGGSMVLDGIDVHHQKLVAMDAKQGTWEDEGNEDEEDKDENEHEGKNEDENAKKATQVARVGGMTRRQLPWRKKERLSVVIPQVGAAEVTVVLKIPFSNLPPHLLGNMASVTILEHEEELLALLHEQQAFYTFFKMTDGVLCRTIDEVTGVPTGSPTTNEFLLAKQAAEEAALLAANATALEVVDEGIGFGVFVSLGLGFLWCCLTAISVAYLLSARGQMEDQRDMEQLLKAEKANPLDNKSENTKDVGTNSRSRAAVPHGDAECGHAKPEDNRMTESTVSFGARGDHRGSTVIRAMESKAAIRDAHRGDGVGAHRVGMSRVEDAATSAAPGRQRFGKSMVHPPSFEEKTKRKEDSAARKLHAKSIVAKSSHQKGMDQKDRGIGQKDEGRRVTAVDPKCHSKSMISSSSSDEQMKRKKNTAGGQRYSSMVAPPSSEKPRHHRSMVVQRRHGEAKTDASDLDALERDLAKTNEKALKSSMKRRTTPTGKGHRGTPTSASLKPRDKKHVSHDDLRSSHRSPKKNSSASNMGGDSGIDDLHSSASSKRSHSRKHSTDPLRSSRRSKGSQDGRSQSSKNPSHS